MKHYCLLLAACLVASTGCTPRRQVTVPAGNPESVRGTYLDPEVEALYEEGL